jgi:hypothetical protein
MLSGFSRWSASGSFPSGMGSIPGGGEIFSSEYPQKIQKKINVWWTGKPSTYFEGSGTLSPNGELPEIKKKMYSGFYFRDDTDKQMLRESSVKRRLLFFKWFWILDWCSFALHQSRI